MKKRVLYGLAVIGFIGSFFLQGCGGYGGDSIIGFFDEDFFWQKEASNILIIVGEGGPSGKMFIRAGETYKKENGGELYEVKSGDEFVDAMKDFVEKNGKIDHLEFFGHGNNVGLYVNQEPNVNGGLYANDPRLNEDYLAASIYDVDREAFNKNGWMKFNGCNVADGYPEEDTLAQRMANYFDADVVAPIGPTEFSKVPNVVNPIENSNYLAPNFSGDVYMVPTYLEKGFVVVRPQEAYGDAFVDVRHGQSFAEAVYGLLGVGFDSERLWASNEYLSYRNVNYAEAVYFCQIVFGEDADCHVSGYKNDHMIRNLDVLRMFADASGAELVYSNPWYQSYISWANLRGFLTKDFVNKRWYTRGEIAELAWNFISRELR